MRAYDLVRNGTCMKCVTAALPLAVVNVVRQLT